MVTEHVLTQSDTLFSLADQYLDDSNLWLDIVEYNSLSAPYIVESREEVEALTYGQGFLTVKRSAYANPLVVKAGWRFNTKPYFMGGVVRTFAVTSDIEVPSGTQQFYVHVRCLDPGEHGNVAEGAITETGTEFVQNNISFESVTNEQPFTGGSNIRVLAIGDSIFIPSDDGSETILYQDVPEMVNYLIGEDLALESLIGDGLERSFTEDGYGDIKTTNGLENIEQAITDRLMTEKGELPLHPEYGTDLASVVGTAQTPYSTKLAEIEIYEALSYEDRISDVQITRLEIVGTSIHIDLSYSPSPTTRKALLSLILHY